jgi:hypothetical protein
MLRVRSAGFRWRFRTKLKMRCDELVVEGMKSSAIKHLVTLNDTFTRPGETPSTRVHDV